MTPSTISTLPRSIKDVSPIGSLLLGYFAPDGDSLCAGRVGTGMPVAELERVWQRLRPLAIDKMRLSVLPPRNSRFGSPRVLSKIQWVRPEMIVEVSYVRVDARWSAQACGLFG